MWEIWSITEGLESYINETFAERRIEQLKRSGKKFTVNFVDC